MGAPAGFDGQRAEDVITCGARKAAAWRQGRPRTHARTWQREADAHQKAGFPLPSQRGRGVLSERVYTGQTHCLPLLCRAQNASQGLLDQRKGTTLSSGALRGQSVSVGVGDCACVHVCVRGWWEAISRRRGLVQWPASVTLGQSIRE